MTNCSSLPRKAEAVLHSELCYLKNPEMTGGAKEILGSKTRLDADKHTLTDWLTRCYRFSMLLPGGIKPL